MDGSNTIQSDVKPTAVSYHQQLLAQALELEEGEKSLGLWKSFKQYKKVVLYSMTAYSCAAVYGYDTIANGASLALPSFSLYFGHYDEASHIMYLDSLWTSLWSSMTGVGQIVGSAIAGILSQKIGRRYTGIGFSLLTVVGVALQYIAESKGLLLAGKMVNGIAVGALLSVGTTYASEIAPPVIRGSLLGGLAFFIIIMQTVGLAIVRAFVSSSKPSAFRTVFALQWLVGGLPVIPFILSPETPNYYLLKGRPEAARRCMSRLYGENNSVDIRVAHLQNAISKELKRDQNASYIDCFRGKDRKRTLTGCLLQLGTGLIGSAFLTQNIYFLTLSGLPVIRCFDINIGGFCLALLILPISWYCCDKFGRRPLYLTGVLGNMILMAIVGGLGFMPSSNEGAIWTIAVLLNLLITWQLFTVSLISWAMPPELSSYKLRQPTQSINIMMQALSSWVFAFVTPYMYNLGAGSGNLGAKTGFVFAGSSALLFAMAWIWIPEMKGLSTEELDWLYENEISPRRFAKTEVPKGEERNGSANW